MDPGTTNPQVSDRRHWLYNPVTTTIQADELHPDNSVKLFLKTPLYAPLLFTNVQSDARDHCANERTFLSWLRLSIFLTVVSVAIYTNFHLKHQPTPLERSLSQPLGLIFWILAVVCLVSGVANYMKTVTKYANRRALVQSGIKTQFVSLIVATAIIVACGLFLGSEAQASRVGRRTIL
ncbi:hypothetical protein PV10_04616 [Exophiala mesophila]|uniref:DUF202 domain-containing protein n=1 Tax=Exophiala mesophila TaxID=212818 RepID=A0A0D2A2Z4_EXOME|nr:uncharacterized protein PV10_04616 [Exophiala mesophila]KIV93403.1 hypothetical protein PV10_04616 [Exophiala mesophila]